MSAPFFEDKLATLYVGDCREVLASLPESSARTCVTSPPYWGLRDYGVQSSDWPEVTFTPMPGMPSMTLPPWQGALGLEPEPWLFVGHLVLVFRAVFRVLADDGTLWLNLGDTYCTVPHGPKGANAADRKSPVRERTHGHANRNQIPGLKHKDLVGIPWRVALALQADGWHLRSDTIWEKPNAIPESVTDRPTRAHEYVFLLTRAPQYAYHASAIAESTPSGTRNARSVWRIHTRPSGVKHFATMPPELAQRCILAGSAPGDTVLDPFSGAGTTGLVAMQHGRRYLGVELNQRYADASVERWRGLQQPLFAAGGGL